MANRVTYQFVAVDKFSAVARDLKQGIGGIAKGMRKMAQEAKKAAAPYKELASRMRGVGLAASAVGATITAAGVAALRESAKFEDMGLQLEVLAGSAEKGRAMLERLNELQFATPVSMEALFEGSKRLLNFGFTAEQVAPQLRQLSDVALGTGKDFSGLVEIIGRAKLGVTSAEIKSLRQYGIDLAAVFSQKLGTKVSKKQVAAWATAGAIKFEHLAAIFDDLTKKGGKFYGVTERQQQSLTARWDDFKTAVSEVARAFGDVIAGTLGISGGLEGMTTKLREFAGSVRVFAWRHPDVVKFGVALAGIAVALGPVILGAAALVGTIASASIAFALFGTVTGAALLPILAFVAAFAAIGVAGALLYSQLDNLKLSFKLLAGDISEGFSAIVADAKSVALEAQSFFTTGVIGKALEFVGMVDAAATSKSQTSIDLNIAAPKGVVKSVKSKTTGDTGGLDLGVSMAEAM